MVTPGVRGWVLGNSLLDGDLLCWGTVDDANVDGVVF